MPDDTIAELFARDPMTYAFQDIDRIIHYYRERRKDFNLTGKAKPVEKKVDLADLGLI